MKKRLALVSFCLVAAASATAQDQTPTLTVHARGVVAAGVGPVMELRVNGVAVARQEVRSTSITSYKLQAPGLRPGVTVDLVYANDGTVAGVDRNLYVGSLTDGTVSVLPSASIVSYDLGQGTAALDGVDVRPGQGDMYWGGALRLVWPTPVVAKTSASGVSKYDAARFLQQATFGATESDVARVMSIGYASWITEQQAMPLKADFVQQIESKYQLGDAYRPRGSRYNPAWVTNQFWRSVATSQDQLRRRVGFALHQIFMVSQAESNLWAHARAYANYYDNLNRHAFGNFRDLLEEVALSPAMGLYLSHIRNRKEDPVTGRLPDENFAREVMQLFTIGLHELNPDGTARRDENGAVIETYNNDDVMALAKVFTGWSWALPDDQLSEYNFRWRFPNYTAAGDVKSDLGRMKAYPGMHSISQKLLFQGKPHGVTISAGGTAESDLRIALDSLFNHPNVAPFVSRQLIQHLVTSNPSPAYVSRVAAVFNRNERGLRGDLGSVVRAILLDPEARSAPSADFGKLKEPVLRVAQWMRAFNARSVTGEFMMPSDLESLQQRPNYSSSVFGYYRPGYIPPNTAFTSKGATAPEFQVVNETTVAEWVNVAETMAIGGLGWTGSGRDVVVNLDPHIAVAAAGNVDTLIENLNVLLFAGRMSSQLKLNIIDAVSSVKSLPAAVGENRARIALFIALASPEYLVQR